MKESYLGIPTAACAVYAVRVFSNLGKWRGVTPSSDLVLFKVILGTPSALVMCLKNISNATPNHVTVHTNVTSWNYEILNLEKKNGKFEKY